jgi:hypothetical protein
LKQSEPSEKRREPRCEIDTWGTHFALLSTATASSPTIAAVEFLRWDSFPRRVAALRKGEAKRAE